MVYIHCQSCCSTMQTYVNHHEQLLPTCTNKKYCWRLGVPDRFSKFEPDPMAIISQLCHLRLPAPLFILSCRAWKYNFWRALEVHCV